MNFTVVGPFDRPEINPFTLPDHPFNKLHPSQPIHTELDAYEAQNAVAKSAGGKGRGERGASSSLFNPAEALLHLDEASRRVEKAIWELCGRGSRPEWDAAQRLFWSQSAYSPQRLTSELGWEPPFPNPDPRKGRGHAAPSASRDDATTPSCTWFDAFEDLALMGSGLPMRDLRDVAAENEPGQKWAGYELSANLYPWVRRSGFGSDGRSATVKEVMKSAKAVARLNGTSSIYSYLPLGHGERGFFGDDRVFSPRTIEEWKTWRLHRQNSGEEQDRKKMELAAKSSEAWFRYMVETSRWGQEAEEQGLGFTRPGRLWGELKRSLDQLEAGFVEEKSLGLERPEDGIKRRHQGGIAGKEVSMSTPEVVSEEVLEGGIVKKTVKTEIRDRSGKVIGSRTNISWTNGEGHVVKIENSTEISTATTTSTTNSTENIGSGSSRTEERSWSSSSWSWSGADGKKSDVKEDEGQVKESGLSKYRKWSLWK